MQLTTGIRHFLTIRGGSSPITRGVILDLGRTLVNQYPVVDRTVLIKRHLGEPDPDRVKMPEDNG